MCEAPAGNILPQKVDFLLYVRYKLPNGSKIIKNSISDKCLYI